MIYAVTMFSNELDILDLRLHELDTIVDKFIIVEHPFDYLRQPKRMIYDENKNRFKEFHHKIIHIIDGELYDNQLGLDLMWSRINSNLIYNTLSQANDDNLFTLFMDSDVIIKKDIVTNLDLTKPTVFHMDWYESYFNYKFTTITFQWITGLPFSLIKKYGLLQSHRFVRKEIQPPEDFNDTVIIKNSGYHFSKSGDIDDLVWHIKGHPHIELATNTKICNREWLQNRRDTGKKWDDVSPDSEPVTQGVFELVSYDPKNYPDYINENPQIFEKYFKGGM
jgi:beta-1,4-mannosyl-glycoprotein beta-1,4-N-acetylglucosaminyltransferase